MWWEKREAGASFPKLVSSESQEKVLGNEEVRPAKTSPFSRNSDLSFYLQHSYCVGVEG